MAASGPEGVTSPAVPLQWPLVDRHEEIELFEATLVDPRAHGFVIHGPAGVGKTRLADQCLAVADGAGRNVARATASEGLSTVPLGALAHLLPGDLGDRRSDLVAVVAEVRVVLLDQAGSGPLVLFVDDLHLLDPTSAALVGQLVDADLAFLVGTVRTGADVSPGIDSLWQRARVRRVDLPDLTPAGVDTLLHLVLRGPVEASTITEIWNRSRGNVLFVRELVLGALDGGHLVDQRGVWRLVRPLTATPRLTEVVAARLRTLDPATADALDTLAVWEPAGLTLLEAQIGRPTLEALDRLGFLTLRTDRRRQHVSLAHPLYGEILRARMPVLKRRRLLLDRADAIDARGARRREDPISVANARLEASGSADPRLLVRAARLARYGQDFPQVVRLGRAALVDRMTPEAGLLVGEALHELGEFDEADDVLTAAVASASDDDELRVPLAEMRARNLMWGLFRHDEAREVNHAARRQLGDRPGCEELVLNEAMLLTYSGRPGEALTVLDTVGDLEGPRHRAMRALAEVPALIATGRAETGIELAATAFAEHMQLPDQVAIPGPGMQILNQMYGLAECGRLEEAAAMAAAAYRATPAASPPDVLMWFSQQQGRCALLAGRMETARRWLTEALSRCEEHHIVGPRRLVLSALATAAACLGDADGASAMVAELDRLPTFPFTQAEQELGRAWALVARGDLAGGRRVLQTAADAAAEAGYRSSEAWLLHDVVRLGEPQPVAERLRGLATVCEGDLVATYALHAVAASSGDGDALAWAADDFERLGAFLLAAEAATDASQAFQRSGDRRKAAALAVRASTLTGSCEGARTPGLSNPVMVVPLTSRERDIALLARAAWPARTSPSSSTSRCGR